MPVSGKLRVVRLLTIDRWFLTEDITSQPVKIGPGVTIKNGARVTINAPRVNLKNFFYTEKGVVIRIKQQ